MRGRCILFVVLLLSLFSISHADNCTIISSPGTYTLANDINGSPISSAPVAGVTCIKIASSNVVFDCNGYNITSNSSTPSRSGIVLNGSLTNVTVKNCIIKNYTNGIYVYYSNSSTFLNNTLLQNSQNGIRLENCNRSNITLNYENGSYYGFYLTSGTGNVFHNNTARGSNRGIQLSTSIGNNMTSNTLFNNTDAINLFGNSNHTLVYDNTIFNNTNGLVFSSSHYNTIENNLFYKGYQGISLSSSFNRFANNRLYNFSYQAISVGGSNNTIINNIAINSTSSSFSITGSSNNLTNNSAYLGNTGFVFGGSNNRLENSSSHDNLVWGVSFQNSNGSFVSNVQIYNNQLRGVHSSNANLTLLSVTFYNNTRDLEAAAGIVGINLSGCIFTNPYGTMENYTNLSLYDTMPSAQPYFINWAPAPSSLPNDRLQFENKFIRISNSSSTAVSIDSITWHWSDSEATGHNESRFEIWSNGTSGWRLYGSSLSTSSNSISVSNLNPASDYGILENNQSNCINIASSGQYWMGMDFTGAPLNASPYGDYACVMIGASNVVFDCAGHNITNNGTAGSTFGILTYSSSNITIRNCPSIANYEYPVYLYRTNSSVVRNVSTSGATATAGIFPFSSYYNSIENCVTSGLEVGIAVTYSEWNNISNCVVANNSRYGIQVSSGANYTRLANNTAYNNSLGGIRISASHNGTLINNTAYNNSPYGISVSSSNGTNLTGNSAYNNTQYGFQTSASHYNQINGNSAYNNTMYGFTNGGSNNNTYLNNAAFRNGQRGFHFGSRSSDNNLTNNSVYGQPVGFFLGANATNNYFVNNTAYDNSERGFNIQLEAHGNRFVSNIVYNNTLSGFILSDSYNNTFTNNTIRDSPGSGVQITAGSENNSLANNSAYSNAYGTQILDSTGTSLSSEHFYNNTVDLLLNASSSAISYSLASVVLDGPAGNFQNYTNLSASDTAGAGISYSVAWASEPAALPPNTLSFLNKYSNITSLSGSVSIDSITWHWAESELSGYNESSFELWKHNSSGWEMLNNSPNTSANTLSLSGMNPASEYGILERSPYSGCVDIFNESTYQGKVMNSSGNYHVSGNVTLCTKTYSLPGAQMIADASSIAIDLNGSTIDGPGSGYGINISGFSYLDIKNGIVQEFDEGILSAGGGSSNFTNISFTSNSQYGVHFSQSGGNILGNCSFSQNGHGVYLQSAADNNTVRASSFADNTNAGIYIANSSVASLQNISTSGGARGLWMDLSTANVETMSLSSHTSRAIDLRGAFNSSFSDIVIYGISGSAYVAYLEQSSGAGCSNITFTSVTANDTSNYFHVGPMALSDPIEMVNFTINDDSGAQVIWPSVNITSGDDYITSATFRTDPFSVSLDSSLAQPFNTTARITLKTPACPATIYTKDGFPPSREDIIQNGTVCTSCTILSCSGDTVTFEVSHFSGYASGGNSELTIDNDGPKLFNETITFTANYSNITDSSHISGATCTLRLYNGSSYPMPESGNLYVLPINATEAGTHNYNLTCSAAGFDTLTALDTFQILGGPSNDTWSLISLYGANVTVISTSRYSPNITAGNLTTEGGNVTEANLSTNASTDRWAGFYGNITGSLVLAQAADVQMMYIWPWDSSYGGVVCASTGSSMGTVNASGANASDIDTAWSFSPSAVDSAANTFVNSGCSLSFGTSNVSNASYADTGSAGGFTTCSLKISSSPSKAQMLFCTNITYEGPLYNGETGDYEMMVPTAYGTNIFETYYFYLNFN